MGKKTITISFDEEKLNALKMYLGQKNTQAEVREFIDMKSGSAPKSADKSRKSKPSSVSAVGVPKQTDGDSV